MQNTVNQNKQTQTVLLRLQLVTCFNPVTIVVTDW